ncbi:phospho-N-acetylmuramoyl-pentapeptide-transferase [Salimicrobium jeotgali]|uniref:Phospho-N-acetylmuramoyl-pentapeptide-transferase n=2 Tax=Salimicrobium TaxID=351195 RepID=K2G9T9_9BACI|nr:MULTISPECIES: phospho-N-acetylmuramoyl-pentapeptide-transferase [Salimicrobium]AKG04651.1 phospho-N-acetylmuramoyl-pentapeptide-transferase [Salimicrobium jeotgali]EKE31853.1 phospho-N-acetylmuramoyl-pentapeptide-transferase [Salimicrobium jeotgali]MBM7696184.1 phospho-N-acetylmuramoyl-pentapeptide-transferase [Salimicrobium jeotgali]SIS61558.1 Phospho-N-acetylmuramoyl-pentapeptide-transferase [Salimicrobium salexigens]
MNDLLLLMTAGIAFLITVALFPVVIPFLRRLKFGQEIREEGPSSHQKKSGTPTMGGVMVLFAVAITTLLFLPFILGDGIGRKTALLLIVLLGYGLIGFLDDYIKVALKRNLGLTSKQKMLMQLVIAAVVYIILLTGDFSTTISIPATDLSVDLGAGYGILLLLMLVGGSNAVNLTDGLDGLLAGTASIAFGAFAILAWTVAGDVETALFSISIVGALLGFLVFNAHPAKVFMGDTGSLALGAAIAMIAIILKMELLLVIVGGVFVLETLSVIIQVASFKLTGKRVFRMSPLHHHYELKGWSEWKVVTAFWIAGLLFAALGLSMEVMAG